YNLEPIKKKIAHTIIDRLPFIHEAVTIVDIAASIYDESCPEIDYGLRKAIIVQVLARLSTIMDDEAAWDAYSSNKMVLKAVHECQRGEMEKFAIHHLAPLPSVVEKKSKTEERSKWPLRASDG
ncbi:SAS complex subunit, partial [Pleosporales sp. CAS-2024a]